VFHPETVLQARTLNRSGGGPATQDCSRFDEFPLSRFMARSGERLRFFVSEFPFREFRYFKDKSFRNRGSLPGKTLDGDRSLGFASGERFVFVVGLLPFGKLVAVPKAHP
jgi:hypothetical protein